MGLAFRPVLLACGFALLAMARGFAAPLPAGPVVAPANAVLPGLPAPLIAVAEGAPPAATSTAPAAAALSAPSVSASPAPVNAAGAPISVMASALPPDPDNGRALLMPFASGVPAAAWRGPNGVVLLVGSDKPIDFSALTSDADFGGAALTMLHDAVLITVPLPSKRPCWIRRRPEGWTVVLDHAGSNDGDIPVRRDGGVLRLTAVGADRVVVVPDPAGGGDLLVGLVRNDRESMRTERRAIGYRLEQTLLGVAVRRLSDDVELRASVGAFLLDGDPGFAAGGDPGASAVSVVAPDGLSRVLRYPDGSVRDLYDRYQTALARAGLLPPARRREARLDAAQDALGLGFAREAGMLVAVAAADDPDVRTDRRAALIATAAAALDPGASPVIEPSGGATDEERFWRGLFLANSSGDAEDGVRLLAPRAVLLRGYPAPLRRRLAGDVAVLLGRHGRTAEAAAFAKEGTSRTSLAALMATPDSPKAAGSRLASLDFLTRDADPVVATEALRLVTEARLANGTTTPAQAAALLDAQLLTARIAGEERPTLLRIAALRGQVGDWPGALAALREARSAAPTATPDVDSAAHAAAMAMERVLNGPAGPARGTATLAIADAVAANPGAIADLAMRASLLLALSDRLRELDLPDRAAMVLGKGIEQTPDGLSRALLQQRLASLEADAHPDTSTPPVSPSAVASTAPVAASASPPATATATTTTATAPAPDATPARTPQDAVAATLAVLPPKGPIAGPAADRLLALAAAAATGKPGTAGLAPVAPGLVARFSDPGQRDLFRLLTAPKIDTIGDLDRSAGDLAAARGALAAIARDHAAGG